MQVVVEGLLTEYERFGDRSQKTMVILHGWADTSASWRSLAKQLAVSFDVVVLNLPGFGGTTAPSQAWGIGEYAGFVGACIAKLGVHPTTIIGHSNGGAIAIRAIVAGYVQSDRLILLASAGIRNVERGKKRALQFVTKAGKMLTLPLPSAAKRRLRRKLYTTIGSDLLVAEHMQDTFRRVVAEDIQADAARLQVPVLLVYGESDESTPPLYGHMLHEIIPHATLELLPGAGHFLQVDAPEKILLLIMEFSS